MRSPTTIYRHDYSRDRRGSNAGVSPHYFTAHRVMGGETCHCAHLTTHCLSPITFEEGYDKARIPRSRRFGLIRPASIQTRRPALFDRKERPTWHRAPGHFTVLSPTSPRCPGIAGHSWSTPLQSLLQESTTHHLKTPRCPGLLLPYKRADQGSTRG
jgi:hypothetical protein